MRPARELDAHAGRGLDLLRRRRHRRRRRLGRPLGAGSQRDAAGAGPRLSRCRPAASSSCRCTTTCSATAASRARPTSRASGCGSPTAADLKRAGHVAAAGAGRAALHERRVRPAVRPRRRGPGRRPPLRRARPQASAEQLNQVCNHGNPRPPRPTQHCDHPCPCAGTVYAVAGHMHLLGRSIKVRAQSRHARRPQAARRSDLQLRRAGSSRCRSRWRSSRATPCGSPAPTTPTLRKRLPQLRTLPPRYVVWGDGTSDEMCLGLIVWSPNP